MRALIATPYYPPHPGGIERHSAGVSAELRQRGWAVDVVHCVDRPGIAESVTGPSGERLVGLESVLVGGRLPFLLPTRRNRALLREIRGTTYDFALVQSHLFLSNLLLARAVGGRHTVWLNHGCDHVAAGNPAVDVGVALYEHLLARQLRKTTSAVAGVSQEAAAWLSHLRVTTDASVGNAVTTVSPPRSGRRPGPLRVVSVGRLEPAKGALEAIRLVDRLPASTDVELTICGGGSIAEQVAREAAASSARVVLTGPVPHEQVQAHLADADVIVCLSDSEGFPTVLLEAGAAGCAVITYAVGGTQELLRDGGGWRVRGLDEAADRLLGLAEDPARATAAGDVLRRTVERRFTWPPVVDRLLRLGEVSGSPVAPVALRGALVPVAADGPWREPDVAVAG